MARTDVVSLSEAVTYSFKTWFTHNLEWPRLPGCRLKFNNTLTLLNYPLSSHENCPIIFKSTCISESRLGVYYKSSGVLLQETRRMSDVFKLKPHVDAIWKNVVNIDVHVTSRWSSWVQSKNKTTSSWSWRRISREIPPPRLEISPLSQQT